jgi:hypothetical protein
MVLFEVVSLFTEIPIKEALRVLSSKLSTQVQLIET